MRRKEEDKKPEESLISVASWNCNPHPRSILPSTAKLGPCSSFTMAILISAFPSAAIGILLLWTLFTRVRNWYRLRHIPGPPAAAWSKLWLAQRQYGGKLLTHLRETSKKYGTDNGLSPPSLLS
ncbi:hypothetical protein N657DRAFT_319964 [Parathielavia appendiculata]|uniref:Uncharacterized protein n=1 Tax=Parathielavia appendiculata TaxID=2587402 RepID=A0AAN6TQX1_9PEZI|nr:hypothetical protein N657DRAFT_319964 [Parathielavia appendiculata]